MLHFLLLFVYLGKHEETAILNLNSGFSIKDPKRKVRKKLVKKKVDLESMEIKTKNATRTGT